MDSSIYYGCNKNKVTNKSKKKVTRKCYSKDAKGGNENGKSFIKPRSVPEAKGALDKFKYEVASELGVPLSDGYNGDLTSKQNGSVGGYMVKKMIEQQEKQMAGK